MSEKVEIHYVLQYKSDHGWISDMRNRIKKNIAAEKKRAEDYYVDTKYRMVKRTITTKDEVLNE